MVIGTDSNTSDEDKKVTITALDDGEDSTLDLAIEILEDLKKQ